MKALELLVTFYITYQIICLNFFSPTVQKTLPVLVETLIPTHGPDKSKMVAKPEIGLCSYLKIFYLSLILNGKKPLGKKSYLWFACISTYIFI